MFWERFHVFKQHPLLAWPLILGNLAAVWWGYTDYYDSQLSQTSPGLRPFVADSPNAVLLFAVVVILFQVRVRSALLDLLAWVANVKVGLWTMFVLLYYYDAFFSEDPVLRWILFWLHLGMIAQVLALVRDLRTRPLPWWAFAGAGAWFLLGDGIDYHPSVHLHPLLRGDPDHRVVAVVTVAFTIGALTWAWAWFRPGRTRAHPQTLGTAGSLPRT